MIYSTTVPSPVGKLTIACTDEGIIGLWQEGQKHFPDTCFFSESSSHPILIDASYWLDEYFFGNQPDPHSLPLCPDGTIFQKRIWELLIQIPYGSTITYGQLAIKADCSCSQAIGSAVGRNPVSIIIPCHRVIGADGKLTGYAGGLNAKRMLLEHEWITTIR